MVNKELCREVARRIENVSPEGLFDMSTWGYIKSADLAEGGECNTIACAAGHTLMAAGYMPMHDKRIGFTGYKLPGKRTLTGNFSMQACYLLGIRETPLFYSIGMPAEAMVKFFDMLADGWGVEMAEQKAQEMV